MQVSKRTLAALACWILQLLPVAAQDYPSQPVRAINAMGAGGMSDVFLRALGEELQKRWGQPVVVENRPGGGMTTGPRACASAPKDGSTICLFPGESIVFNPFLMKNPGYDAERDFVPVTLAFFSPQVLVANSGLGVRTLGELAALSKAKPTTLSYFSASIPLQVVIDRWNKATGADLVWVMAKSGSEAVNGVLSGSTPVAFYGVPNFMELITAGAVKPIAIDSHQRVSVLPETPTLLELGLGAGLPRTFFGIYTPAGTPKPIVDKLFRDVAAVGALPDFRKRRLEDFGQEPVFSTPEAFAQFLKDERVVSERIIKEAGLDAR